MGDREHVLSRAGASGGRDPMRFCMMAKPIGLAVSKIMESKIVISSGGKTAGA